MENENKKTSGSESRWTLIRRVVLVLFDIFAVNASYYGALLIRFYVNGQFHTAGTRYPGMFLRIAPWYTICCIVVFVLFKLYDGVWQYAGLNDLNRIFYANLATFVIQLVGSLLFVGRMPLTYYGLGAIIQFLFIAFSRFSFRLYKEEKTILDQKSAGFNIMIIGVDQTASMILHQLKSNQYLGQPVCFLDYRNQRTGRTMDGLPILGGIETIGDAVKKYGVRVVIIADTLMPVDVRKEIRGICGELDVDVQDFSGYFQRAVSGIDVKNLLEITNGPVEIQLDDMNQRFDNGEQAALTLSQKYAVKNVSAHDGVLKLEIRKDTSNGQLPDEAYMEGYNNEQDVSFF